MSEAEQHSPDALEEVNEMVQEQDKGAKPFHPDNAWHITLRRNRTSEPGSSYREQHKSGRCEEEMSGTDT